MVHLENKKKKKNNTPEPDTDSLDEADIYNDSVIKKVNTDAVNKSNSDNKNE